VPGPAARPSMPAGMELPESVVFTCTHIPETVLSDLANQSLWQGLVVGNLQHALGSLVLCQFLAKWLQPRRCWREVEVGIASSASGATRLRIAYSRRKCGWPSRGAARIYSAIVVGRSLAISLASTTDARCRVPNGSRVSYHHFHGARSTLAFAPPARFEILAAAFFASDNVRLPAHPTV